jgi:hypothetical protein
MFSFRSCLNLKIVRTEKYLDLKINCLDPKKIVKMLKKKTELKKFKKTKPVIPKKTKGK